MDDAQEKLFTLMALAEEQQKIAQTAFDELTQTTQALTAATETLAHIAHPALSRRQRKRCINP